MAALRLRSASGEISGGVPLWQRWTTTSGREYATRAGELVWFHVVAPLVSIVQK